MVVRRASIDDLKVIQRLNNELFELELNGCDDSLVKDWPLTIDGEEYFKELILKDYVYVCVDDGNVVGYLAGSIVSVSYIKNKYAEVNNMCISNDYRGKGVGTLLFDKFRYDVKELGIMELRVTASSNNSNARKFYEKNGFNEFEVTYRMKL
jgi:N-acetylglutamate synthase-like GNAT family acetyltransferase